MDGQTAKAKYRQASELYAKKDYGAALALLEEMLEAFPGNEKLIQTRERVLTAARRASEVEGVEGQASPHLEGHGSTRKKASSFYFPRQAHSGVLRAHNRRLFLWMSATLCALCLVTVVVWGLLERRNGSVLSASEARTGPKTLSGNSASFGEPKEAQNALAVQTRKGRQTPSTLRAKTQSVFLTRPSRVDINQFSLVSVELKAFLPNGLPLPQGKVVCLNQELGLLYPHRGTGRELSNGSTVIHLPRGRTTVIVHGSSCFLSRTVTLEGDCAVRLQPDATIHVDLQGIDGRPLPGTEVCALPSALKPLLPLLPCGVTEDRPFILHVAKGAACDLVLVKRPPLGYSDGEAYLLHAEDIQGPAQLRLHANKQELANVRFSVTNGRGEQCPGAHLNVQIPSCSLTGPFFFRDKNIHWDVLDLWMTPEVACLGIHVWPAEGWRFFNFLPKTLHLKAGETHQIAAGGTLTSTAWFYPVENPRKVWIQVTDGFGGGLADIATSPEEPLVIHLLDSSGRRIRSESLYGTFDKELTQDPKGLEYEISLDLGFFGDQMLAGRCFDSGNTLTMMSSETAHFELFLPERFTGFRSDLAKLAESSYAAISQALDLDLVEKAQFAPTLFCVGWTGGSRFACHVNFLRDPRSFDSFHECFKGAFSHELGHVFQGKSNGLRDFGGPCPLFKEAFATLMRRVALDELIGERNSAYYDFEHRENFFMTLYRGQGHLDELQRDPHPDCFGNYWRYYFILSYLTDVFGADIHAKYARMWGDRVHGPKCENIQSSVGLSADEVLCALYSMACETDLTELFRVSGFEISEEKVRECTDLLPELQELDIGK